MYHGAKITKRHSVVKICRCPKRRVNSFGFKVTPFTFLSSQRLYYFVVPYCHTVIYIFSPNR